MGALLAPAAGIPAILQDALTSPSGSCSYIWGSSASFPSPRGGGHPGCTPSRSEGCVSTSRNANTASLDPVRGEYPSRRARARILVFSSLYMSRVMHDQASEYTEKQRDHPIPLCLKLPCSCAAAGHEFKSCAKSICKLN
jgi:hypothetical protein